MDIPTLPISVPFRVAPSKNDIIAYIERVDKAQQNLRLRRRKLSAAFGASLVGIATLMLTGAAPVYALHVSIGMVILLLPRGIVQHYLIFRPAAKLDNAHKYGKEVSHKECGVIRALAIRHPEIEVYLNKVAEHQRSRLTWAEYYAIKKWMVEHAKSDTVVLA